MIFGIGTDIVKISRIEDMKSLSRFAEKILSTEEHKLASSYKDEKLIKFLGFDSLLGNLQRARSCFRWRVCNGLC